MVFQIIESLNPKKLIEFKHKDEEKYFPLPKELRNNVSTISDFLINLCESENKPEIKQGIKNDKDWSATEALSSL